MGVCSSCFGSDSENVDPTPDPVSIHVPHFNFQTILLTTGANNCLFISFLGNQATTTVGSRGKKITGARKSWYKKS